MNVWVMAVTVTKPRVCVCKRSEPIWTSVLQDPSFGQKYWRLNPGNSRISPRFWFMLSCSWLVDQSVSRSTSHPGSFHSTCQSVLEQDPDSEDQPPLLQLDCAWCLIPTSLLGILPECECMGRDPLRGVCSSSSRLFSLIWLLFSQSAVSFSSFFSEEWAGNVAPMLWLYAFPQRFSGQII